jgi:hypothetical protein
VAGSDHQTPQDSGPFRHEAVLENEVDVLRADWRDAAYAVVVELRVRTRTGQVLCLEMPLESAAVRDLTNESNVLAVDNLTDADEAVRYFGSRRSQRR